MKNLICKGISYMPAVASVLVVIALSFEIADHIKSWRKEKKETANTPEEHPGGGDEKK